MKNELKILIITDRVPLLPSLYLDYIENPSPERSKLTECILQTRLPSLGEDIRLSKRMKYISTDIREYMNIRGYPWISMYTLPGYGTGLGYHFCEEGGSNIRVGYPNAPLTHGITEKPSTK